MVRGLAIRPALGNQAEHFDLPIGQIGWPRTTRFALPHSGSRENARDRIDIQATGTEDGWDVTLCTKEGLWQIRAATLVDCTGDADVVAQAGLRRIRNDLRQPGTIMVRMAGYDPEDLDYEAITAAHGDAVARGALRTGDLTDQSIERFLRRRGKNAIHVPGVDGGTSGGRTAAELSARRALMRIFRFLKEQSGLHDLTIENWAVECGIRETYTIDARARITADDYTSGRRWDDAVSYSFYPIDVHRPDGHGIDIRPLRYGTVPTIPRVAPWPRRQR
jgi:hypothetical protein